MYLSHLRMLIHGFLNKYPDIVPEGEYLIILYIKYTVCMAKNGKDTNHTSHIAIRVNFVINGKKYKFLTGVKEV